RAVPTAMLNRSRYLMLVFSDSRSPEERAAAAAEAQADADRQAAEETGQEPQQPPTGNDAGQAGQPAADAGERP
ncbi:MAG: rod shape-determining protein MreC, partial [Pseudomonas sp.]